MEAGGDGRVRVSFAMRGGGNKCHQVGNIRALFPETGRQ